MDAGAIKSDIERALHKVAQRHGVAILPVVGVVSTDTAQPVPLRLCVSLTHEESIEHVFRTCWFDHVDSLELPHAWLGASIESDSHGWLTLIGMHPDEMKTPFVLRDAKGHYHYADTAWLKRMMPMASGGNLVL